ncbi:MAG: DUF3717 domain-containing protein [Burkholderiaceae bacterium]
MAPPVTPIRIHELEAAINRARGHEPASGAEARLSDDVSRLGAIYGELIFRRHTVFDADSLPAQDREAVLRWLAD